jgi:hypothetical protein
MVIHSIASAQPRVATLHLIVHELLVFLVVQWQSRCQPCAAKALGPMVFGLIVKLPAEFQLREKDAVYLLEACLRGELLHSCQRPRDGESSGKRTAQALTDGMMEWSGMELNVQEEVGEAADGSGLMRKTIRIPDSRCFRHVVSYYTASDARTLAWPSRMLECQIDAASNLVQQALCPHIVQVM